MFDDNVEEFVEKYLVFKLQAATTLYPPCYHGLVLHVVYLQYKLSQPSTHHVIMAWYYMCRHVVYLQYKLPQPSTHHVIMAWYYMWYTYSTSCHNPLPTMLSWPGTTCVDMWCTYSTSCHNPLPTIQSANYKELSNNSKAVSSPRVVWTQAGSNFLSADIHSSIEGSNSRARLMAVLINPPRVYLSRVQNLTDQADEGVALRRRQEGSLLLRLGPRGEEVQDLLPPKTKGVRLSE
ncbi:hypothetical protein LAZ67_12000579 [Cordylochernes scorpioides]|uniref:Uncharacterized protein n=1 Tax=Cordylochernes scorpioides TaxID=51811 RepID=A0ABY6L2J3_9ARAC|nr:hypothetical protein LAZ67_12000579 [Cordylochernes scorpioides]